MKTRLFVAVTTFALMLSACSINTPAAPAVTPTPVPPTETPVPTWTPAPTPTRTPVPPMRVTLNWPQAVSPVEAPYVDALIQPPAGVDPPVLAYAEILNPDADTVATWELRREDAYHYRSAEPLRLGLEPIQGNWWLIVRINTPLDVVGSRIMPFQIASVPYADLTDMVPAGLTHKVPEAFTHMESGGNLTAGWSKWHSPEGRGELALYWAPGPAEALTLTHAVAMLEATYGDDAPAIEDAVDVDWNGYLAYQFVERWGGDRSALAWVVQSPDRTLYVVRAHPLVEQVPSVLLEDVARGFGFTD